MMRCITHNLTSFSLFMLQLPSAMEVADGSRFGMPGDGEKYGTP